MNDPKSIKLLSISDNDVELKSFFEMVKATHKVVVKSGDDHFVVELRPQVISDDARKMLLKGGPLSDD